MSEKEQIVKLLQSGEILGVEQVMENLPKADKELVILGQLIKVFHAEVENNVKYTIFDYSLDISLLTEHFIKLKLLIRRIEFDLLPEFQNELYEYVNKNQVSVYMITSILLTNIFAMEKVCIYLIDLFKKKEGGISDKYNYLVKVLEYIRRQENE